MKKITTLKSTWLLIFAFIICFGTQAQVYTGDLILSSQSEVNAFNYTVVTGHLDISGNDITDLTALSTLTSVGGYLRISNNTVLSSLAGLENLTSVDGLGIGGNSALTSLTGLENLTSIHGNMRIGNDAALTSLTGLDNITSVGGNLYIGYTAVLTSLAGLDNLTSVGSYFEIIGNVVLTSLTGLDNLTSVGDYFKIQGNDALVSLAGLENLTSVPYLTIMNNATLTSLTGLDNLTSVGNYLEIRDNYVLTSLEGLENLTNVGTSLDIYNNDALTSLAGLENLTSVSYLSIMNNATLTSLAEMENLTYMDAVNISGNPLMLNLIGLEFVTSLNGGLRISFNDALTSLEGLENLTSTGGPVVFEYNAVLTNLAELDNLISVGNYFSINNNAALTSLAGLDNLTSVGSYFEIFDNAALTNLTGLDNLSSLQGGLYIKNNAALTSINGLENITSINTILSISKNDVLTSLSGLDNITSVRDLSIGSNVVLSEFCALYGLINGDGLTGYYSVNMNAVNPTQQEIIDNGPCIYNSPPVAVCQNVTVSADENCQAIVTAAEVNNGSTDPDGDEISLSISPEGPYGIGVTNVTLTADDGMGGTSTCEATITVNDDIPPALTCPADVTLECPADGSVAVTGSATATDVCDQDVTITSSDVSVSGCGNTEVITRTWTATDDYGNSTSCDQMITIADTDPPVITCPADVILECPADVSIAATGSATATDVCDQDVTITSSDVSVPGCGNTETITRTWTATDECGNVTTANQTITVRDEIPPVISGVPSEIVQRNAPGECGANVFFPEISADDYCQAEVVLSIEPASGSFFAVGITSVTVTAVDACGNSTEETFDVIIENQLPVLLDLLVPIDPVSVGSPVSVSLDYQDDNLTEAIIDWGDGNQSDGNISQYAITGDHSYSAPGVYVLIIHVKDACGEEASIIHEYIVIYDPEGGFVTGGGWIFSPEGAYKPDFLLTGKASFGFVSKYKKGSTIPDGNTEFQFKTGNLNFKSTVYEWLVIAGSKAMFKGSGTINSFGNYGFILSAIDADLTPSAAIDKFRIKIWDKDNNDVVVYDNNLEVDDNADPTTEIGGGSIIIHTIKTKSAEIEPGLSSETENSYISVYPNPFNDRLHFEFVSPVDVHACIEIFDITGRKVKTIFNNFIGGGVSYNTEFVPLSEVSNTYFYRVTLGESVFYGKVIYKKR